MSRWEYLALLALVLASLFRLGRQLGRPKKKPRVFDAYERALRIQEERERKYRR